MWNLQKKKNADSLRNRKIMTFSTDCLTLIWGAIKEVVHHRKLTTWPALKEKADHACTTSVTKMTQGMVHCTHKCLEANRCHFEYLLQL